MGDVRDFPISAQQDFEPEEASPVEELEFETLPTDEPKNELLEDLSNVKGELQKTLAYIETQLETIDGIQKGYNFEGSTPRVFPKSVFEAKKMMLEQKTAVLKQMTDIVSINHKITGKKDEGIDSKDLVELLK